MVLCGVWLLPAAQAQVSQQAEVTQLRVERGDDGLYLSANVAFELPAVVEDALYKGISMYFVAEAEVLRERWYWYDQPVVSASRNFRLSYQPLTRRWRMQVSTEGPGLALNQNFDTLQEALAALQRITRWKISDSSNIDVTTQHNLAFSFQLDIARLSRPFQIGAVGQKDWTMVAKRTQRMTFQEAER